MIVVVLVRNHNDRRMNERTTSDGLPSSANNGSVTRGTLHVA